MPLLPVSPLTATHIDLPYLPAYLLQVSPVCGSPAAARRLPWPLRATCRPRPSSCPWPSKTRCSAPTEACTTRRPSTRGSECAHIADESASHRLLFHDDGSLHTQRLTWSRALCLHRSGPAPSLSHTLTLPPLSLLPLLFAAACTPWSSLATSPWSTACFSPSKPCPRTCIACAC